MIKEQTTLLTLLLLFQMADAASAVSIHNTNAPFSPTGADPISAQEILGLQEISRWNNRTSFQWLPEFSFQKPAGTSPAPQRELTTVRMGNELYTGNRPARTSPDPTTVSSHKPYRTGSKTLPSKSTGAFTENMHSAQQPAGFFGMVFLSFRNFMADQSVLHRTRSNTPVPEPTTMFLFGTGLISLAAGMNYKRKAHKSK